MKEEEKLFQKMIDAIIPTILEGTKGGGGRWPMPVFETSFFVGFYASWLIVETFLKVTDKMLAEGKKISDIAKLYKFPSRAARLAHMLPGRSIWNVESDTYLTFAYRVAGILNSLYKGSDFNKNNKNLIYTAEELTPFIQDSEKYLIDENILLVKKLMSVLWLTVEAYHPKFPNTFFEFSGEYKVNDSYLVIKDYHNLKPEYLTFKPSYSFTDIKVIEIYDSPVDFKVDIMCRSLASNQDLPTPKSVVLVVDGVFVTDPILIKKMMAGLLSALEKATHYLNSMNREEIIMWNATIDLYTFIYPLLGKEYMNVLPKNYLELLERDEFKNKYNKAVEWFKSTPKDAEGWTKIFDPRKSNGKL